MFCFLSSGVPFLTLTYLKGFREGKNTIVSSKLSGFFHFDNSQTALHAGLGCSAQPSGGFVWLCGSLLQSSTLLARGRSGCCSLCRSEILCQNTISLQNQHSCPLLVSFFFLDVAKLLLSVWTIIPAAFFFFLCSNLTLSEKRVLSQPQANAPALFFFIFTLRSVCLLSPPSFCKEWYKFTKKNWPNRKGHNWLPVQCAKASCSVTLNNFSKSNKNNNNNNLSLLRLMLLCIMASARPYLYIVPYKLFCTWC